MGLDRVRAGSRRDRLRGAWSGMPDYKVKQAACVPGTVRQMWVGRGLVGWAEVEVARVCAAQVRQETSALEVQGADAMKVELVVVVYDAASCGAFGWRLRGEAEEWARKRRGGRREDEVKSKE